MPASVRDTPTSITAAPGLTMSAVIIRACPAAPTTMSASRTTAAMSARAGVRHRDGGVDALAVEEQRQRETDERRAADHDGPPAARSARRSARAGASRRAGCSRRDPVGRARVAPSTARSGRRRPSPAGSGRCTGSGSRPSGSGSWTRMPWTVGSSTSARTVASTSACDRRRRQVDVPRRRGRPRRPWRACCARTAGSDRRRRRARWPDRSPAIRPLRPARGSTTINSSRNPFPSITIAVTCARP